MMFSAQLLKVILAASVLLGLAAKQICAQSTTPLTVTITNFPGLAISNDFIGLGFELSQQLPNVNGVSGNLFSASNTQLITLFQNMDIRNVRIGGGSAEWTNGAHLAHQDIDNLFGFARAAGVKVIYALQLENGTTNYDDATAKYIWENYRSWLDWFAIGNEPDLSDYWYPPFGTGTDPAITNFSSYMSDWDTFADSISGAVGGTSLSGCDANLWASQIVTAQKSTGRLSLYTEHYYFGGSGPNFNSDQDVSNMLSVAWITNVYPNSYTTYVAPVVAAGFPYRFTELNDVTGGVTNASDGFASALWALDVMHWWAGRGCTGVNFHNNEWLTTDTVFLDGGKNFEVHPKAYGIKAFDLGGHGNIEPLTMLNTSNLNLTAYAVADSANLYVTLINKEYRAGARNAAVTMQLNGFEPGSVAAMYLTVAGGNVEATNGVTLGGAIITNNAPWQGQWTPLGSVTNGQFTVTVPAASAAVVKMAVIPGQPVLAANLPTQVPLVAGKSYTYSVKVNGASPFDYQWFNGTAALASQTNSTLTVTASNPGSSAYSVVITNSAGAVTSIVSTVTVIPQLSDYYATRILANGPAGYWPMQETNPSAPATIETNYGLLGSVGNAWYPANANAADVTFNQSGALAGDGDTAVAFNGAASDSYAFVPRASPLLTLRPPFAIECWIKSSSTAFGDILGEGGSGLNSLPNTGNGGGVRLSYGGNFTGGPDLQLYIYNGNGLGRPSITTPANSVPLGAWHHCVATYDGATAYLYVDGVQEASGTFTMAPDTWSPLTIGAGMWQGAEPQRSYSGSEDEVAIYTNVLSSAQVTSHYLAGTHSNSNYLQIVLADHPLLYYRMDCTGYISTASALCPPAVNYGSAPVNGTYLPGTAPGALAGSPLLPLKTNAVAALLNGVFSCVDAGTDPSFNPSGTQSFTAMAWFRAWPSDGRLQTIMSHGASLSWALNLAGTNGLVVWNSGAGSVASTNVLNDGNWHFVAGVFDGAENDLYVDGTLNNVAAAFGIVPGNPNDDIFLGGDPDHTSVGGNQRYFAGIIAQAAFFTNALNAAQIQSIYLAGTTPPPVLALTIQLTGNSQPQLNWNYGTLQTSTNVAGPYSNVFNVASPYIIPATNIPQFYRLRVN